VKVSSAPGNAVLALLVWVNTSCPAVTVAFAVGADVGVAVRCCGADVGVDVACPGCWVRVGVGVRVGVRVGVYVGSPGFRVGVAVPVGVSVGVDVGGPDVGVSVGVGVGVEVDSPGCSVGVAVPGGGDVGVEVQSGVQVAVKVDVGTVWCSLLWLSVAQTPGPELSRANANSPRSTMATRLIQPRTLSEEKLDRMRMG